MIEQIAALLESQYGMGYVESFRAARAIVALVSTPSVRKVALHDVAAEVANTLHNKLSSPQ